MKIKLILLVLLLTFSCLLSGCIAVVGAGAVGAIAYVLGDLEIKETKDLNSVYIATQQAYRDLNLVIEKNEKDEIGAIISAHDVHNERITVKLVKEDENTTKISIRVGLWGDEKKSRLVYSQIWENLY